MTEPIYSIGSDQLPGLAKLAEECGELLQVIGKIIAMGHMGYHPDGGKELSVRLNEELADVDAAMHFFRQHNILDDDAHRERRHEKMRKFKNWHSGKLKKPLSEIGGFNPVRLSDVPD